MRLTIPTEPIGSIPRPGALIRAIGERDSEDPALDALYDEAIRDTIERFESTGFPVMDDRQRLGVHTCPGGDLDSTHSADVDYADLLPSLFELMVGSFYIALAAEADRVRVLRIIRDHLKPHQRVFIGVIATIDPHIETPEQLRDRTLEAAEFIPLEQLGTTDDCGFAPFCDDMSTSRDTAFAKIGARVVGTTLASRILGGD